MSEPLPSGTFDLDELRRRLKDERHIDAVVERLYGAVAQKELGQKYWQLADILGGRGDSCHITRKGDYAGRWRDHNPAGPHEKGDLIDAARHVLGMGAGEAIAWLGRIVGLEPQAAPMRPRVVAGKDVAPKGAERIAVAAKLASQPNLRRLQRRLQQEPAALAYLAGRGLNAKTIARFWLGLCEPYPEVDPKTGDPVASEDQITGAITSPVIDRAGRPLSRMPRTVLPGLTKNAPCGPDGKGWCTGEPLTYWSGAAEGKRWLFIAEGMKDLWRLAQEIEGTSLDARMVIITSTHGSAIPEEWKEASFWAPWERVFCGHDNDAAGEEIVQKRILAHALRDLYRVEVPRDLGKDWTDFFRAGGDLASFEALLANALPVSRPLPTSGPKACLEDEDLGLHEADPININAAWVNGALYYPFRVRETSVEMVRQVAPDGTLVDVPERVYRYTTLVARSDGKILGIRRLKAPKNTGRGDQLTVLDDGTEIISVPQPAEFATWRYSSISHFKEALAAKRAPHRVLKAILEDVLAYFRKLVWLPYDDDYALVTAYVAMSYVYPVFDAVPHILINGEKDSGKSTLAEGIADLSFNGAMLGGGSDKSFARFVDQGRGLLVIDDLEKVGRNGEEGGFSDINQLLKLAYSKAGGKKSVTDGKTGATRILDFYGPKVITNISGIDAVNMTRMFPIYTRKMPPAVAISERITGPDRAAAEQLRQELHCWGMANAGLVHGVYRQQLASSQDRAKQIRAPILAILEIAGDPHLSHLTQKALTRQVVRAKDTHDPQEYLKDAIIGCIQKGCRKTVSLAQIQNELSLAIEPFAEVASQLESTEFRKPNKISQALRHMGALSDQEDNARRRLYGIITRVYELEPAFVDEVLESLRLGGEPVAGEYQGEIPAFAFCEAMACGGCPYAAVCPKAYHGLMEAKESGRGVSAARRRR